MFTVDTRTLTITRSGTGTGTVTSSPLGISCGEDCTEIYSAGLGIELTATPDAGSRFLGFLGDPQCGTSTPCSLVLDHDTSIGAMFASP